MNTQTSSLQPAQETREFITPYALNISAEIIGYPLASPSRRLAALSVDGIFVAILSSLSGTVLAMCAALVMLRLSFKEKTEASLSTRSRGVRITGIFKWALRLIGGCVLLASLIVYIATSLETRETFEAQLNPSATVVADAGTSFKSLFSFKDYSIINWVKGIFQDLGLGFGWASIYFTVFISWWHGQTPGKKLFGIRVIQIDNTPISLWDSFGRYGGYGAGLATGLLGFLQIFWDPNRQAIQDKISSTLVININKQKKHQILDHQAAH